MTRWFRGVAIFGSFFLSSALWAQTTLVQDTEIADYGSPLFGPGSTSITLLPALPGQFEDGAAVILTVVGDEGEIIGNDNTAELTYTLSQGEFASTVPLSTISTTADGVAFQKVGGGAEGDDFVTFSIATGDSHLLNVGDDIIWEVWAVTGVDLMEDVLPGDVGEKNVEVAVTIEVKQISTDPFPDGIIDGDCETNECVVIRSRSPYEQFSMNPPGQTGNVEIDARAVIDSGGTTIDVAADDSREGIELGTHQLDPDTPPLQRNGEDWDLGLTGDGAGSITLTASGNFRPGDIVFIDLDGDEEVDVLELFTINGLFATYTVPAIGVALGESLRVYYVPNEVDDLQPETIGIGASTTYALATNTSEDALPSAGTIVYNGIDRNGYAYGVVKAGGIDKSFVRVTCENSAGCSIFFSCVDNAGTSSFGDAGTLLGNTTNAYDSDEIGLLLGGVVFVGRGACDIFSNRSISTQHMVRSSGILINDSDVIGQRAAFPAD